MARDEERFGQIVRARRRELGLTHAQVRGLGGPSTVTLGKLERGETSGPDFQTLEKLDRALGWKPGSASRALHGGSVTPLQERDPLTTRPDAPITASEFAVILRTDALADFVRRGQRFDDIADRLGDDELTSALASFREKLDSLTRTWIVRQAELAKRRGNVDELVIPLGDNLRRNHTDGDPDALLDLRYLRWLTGFREQESEDGENVEFASRYAKSIETHPNPEE